MRADLDGRATFLVHPGTERQRHASTCPSRPSGRRPGSSARLSDSLRLTNGFKDRACDLLPRVGAVLPGRGSRGGAAAGGGLSALYFLLPDGVCYHGHTVTGGKKTGARPAGAEARSARAAVQRCSSSRWRSTSSWRGWKT